MDQNIRYTDFVKKIKFLMGIRLALVTGVLLAGSCVLQVERNPFYAIIALFYFATIFYAFLLRFHFPVVKMAYLQIFADIVLVTAVVHYGGGADSVYTILYAPAILAAGIVISSNAAKTVAGLSSLFFGGFVALEFMGIIIPVASAQELYLRGIWPVLFIVSFRVIVLCLLGYLSSYLSLQFSEERKALNKLTNLNQLILENISSGVMTIADDSLLTYINPAGLRILSMPERDLIGTHWPDVFWDKPQQKTVDDFLNQAQTPEGAEVVLMHPDGKKVELVCTYSPMLDDKRQRIGAVITFTDLTILRMLELEIRDREKLSLMGEMAAGIAHELRNPLASIHGSLEVLRERGHFSNEGEKLVAVILKESDRLNRIINDFLKYAKDQKPKVQKVDLMELIDEVWSLLRYQGRVQGQVSLKSKVIPTTIKLRIDPEQIKQVFYNLLINSIEAMPQGGIIELLVQEQPGQVKIQLKDNGVGVSAGEKDKIWENFYSSKADGVGVGLTITKRIIEAHNGKIDLEGQVGRGTVVKIELPK